MNRKKINEEVIIDIASLVQIDKTCLLDLAISAKKNERKRIRLCAHGDIDSRLHEMFIIHEKDTYVRPHKHLNNSESFHIISGEADIIIFHDDGSIQKVISMGDYQSGKIFYYRLKAPDFHTMLIRSEKLIFHETTGGPFIRSNTIFADWSPEEKNLLEVNIFLNDLKGRLNEVII